MGTQTPSNFQSLLVEPINEYIVQNFIEVCLTSPLMITVGSAFFALVSTNLPLATLSLSSMIALFLFNVMGSVTGFLASPDSVASAKLDQVSNDCVSSFSTLNGYRFRYFLSQGLTQDVLNKPLYFLSFLGSYLTAALNEYQDEFSRLGPSYSGRPYVAPISVFVVLAIFTLFLYTKGCSSIPLLLTSIVAGWIVGFALAFVVLYVLGRSTLNVTFVPELLKRKSDYICVTAKAQ